MTWGRFQLPGKPKEFSGYATENYYEKTPGRVRRFAYRVDGFVAMRGGDKRGEFLTVEVLDQSGKVIGKSKPLTADTVDTAVKWEQTLSLEKGVAQLRFTIKNADAFSFRFE